MRAVGRMGWVLAMLAGSAVAESLPPLPAWSPSDFEKLSKGEIIPGQDFFAKSATGADSTLTPLPKEILPAPPPEEAAVDDSPTEIAPEFLDRYTEEPPVPPLSVDGQPAYLIDPQELLSRQDFHDRASFLNYHAGESSIDMFVYLFDARQELPADLTIQSVYEAHFKKRGPSAVIFYHLGMPDRSQLILSGDVRAVASEDEQQRALRAAVQEAFEKSDAAYQLDNFLVELSIRLYWIEREMAGLPDRASLAGSVAAEVEAVLSGTHQRDQTWNLISRMIILAGVLIAGILVVWLGMIIMDRRIRYVFPEVESGTLLGAPHAAGVGAVVSFSNAQIPPSQQRDEVPDYLQRM